MVGTYNRSKAKRDHRQVAVDQLTSSEEVRLAKEKEEQDQEDDFVRRMEERGEDPLKMTGKDMDDLHDALDRARGERVPYRQMHQTDHQGRDVFTGLVGIENGQDEGSHHALVDPTERDLHGERSLEKIMNEMPCLHCLGEHHPDADCPADEDVRSYNESQEGSLGWWDDHVWCP